MTSIDNINILIKTGRKKRNELGTVFHSNLYGSRDLKYANLSQNTINSINWENLNYSSPNYFFLKKNFEELASYELGFKVDILFKCNACGIVTARDSLVVHQQKNDLETVIMDFGLLDENSFRDKYNERKDSRDWTYYNAKKDLENATIQRIDYRPFDKRYIIYSSKSNVIL